MTKKMYDDAIEQYDKAIQKNPKTEERDRGCGHRISGRLGAVHMAWMKS